MDNPTAIYATFDGEKLSSDTHTAEVTSVTINTETAIVFDQAFADYKDIVYTASDGTTTFKVTTAAEEFKVEGNVVSKATNIILLSGTLEQVQADQTVRLVNDVENTSTNINVKESELENGYTIIRSEGKVEISGINAKAQIALTGVTDTATVDTTAPLKSSEVTVYTFEGINRSGVLQTFGLKGDTDGIIFTVDSDGYVTDISGLNQDATIEMDSAYEVSINGHKDAEGNIEKFVGKVTIIGLDVDGGTANDAATVYSNGSILLTYPNSGAYRLNSIEEDSENPGSYVIGGSLTSNTILSSADTTTGKFVLANNIVPSADVKVIIANTATNKPLTVTNASGETMYVSGLTNIGGSSTGLAIISDVDLKVVKFDENGTLNEDLTTDDISALSGGAIGIPGGFSLTLADNYKVTNAAPASKDVDSNTGTISLNGTNVNLSGGELTVANAPAGNTFNLAQDYSYKFDETGFDVVANANVRVDSDAVKLVGGTVKLVKDGAFSTVTTTLGEVATYAGEDDIQVVVKAGEITQLNNIQTEGEQFTLKTTKDEAAVTYTLSSIGLTKDGGYLFNPDVKTSGTVTTEALGTEGNWYAIVVVGENDTFKIDANTLTADGSAYVVDSLDNPTKIYGTLTKSGNSYTLTKEGKDGLTLDGEFASFEVDGVEVTFAKEFANKAVTSGNSVFTVTDETAEYTVSDTTISAVATVTVKAATTSPENPDPTDPEPIEPEIKAFEDFPLNCNSTNFPLLVTAKGILNPVLSVEFLYCAGINCDL